MNKIATVVKNIKARYASAPGFLNNPLFFRAILIVLSICILSLTAYFCINAPWVVCLFWGVSPDTKQLIAETLEFQWVPVFLSRLPYVFYVLILNFIALLMGNRILCWLKVDFSSNIDRIIFSIPLGWGIYSMGIFYLGIFGLLYKEAVYCFLTLLGILSVLEIRKIYNITSPLSHPSQGGDKGEVTNNVNSLPKFKLDKTDLIFLPIIIIFCTISFVVSFAPVGAIDALVYHLALPKLYIKQHAFVHIPGLFYSTFPAHIEMLYLLGLVTSGETLSKLFSFSISSLFLFSIFSFGTKYFSKWVGYLATIITMQCHHYFIHYFSEPLNDIALALFVLLGIYALFMWIEERKEGHLYLSIICCASAAATKYHGLFFVLLFFAGFLITVRMDRYFLKKLAWCILAVGIIAMPWYIRSWWLTGDPVFPFLYKYLGAKHWNAYSNNCFWAFHSNPSWKGAKSFYDFIRISKNLFFLGEIGRDSLSPFVVILLIPGLIMFKHWNKLIRYLFFIVLLYYIFFIFTSLQIRFFYVGLAIMSIIVAYFIKIAWTKYLFARIPIILCILGIFVFLLSFTRNIGKYSLFTGLGVLDRSQFFSDSPYSNIQEYYKAATWVNENLPRNSKILFWELGYGYYLDIEYLPVNPAFQGVLDFGKIKDGSTFFKSIKELGITHLLIGYFDLSSPRGQVKEFLDKCISELLEDGRIILVKQIDSSTIYSVVESLEFHH